MKLCSIFMIVQSVYIYIADNCVNTNKMMLDLKKKNDTWEKIYIFDLEEHPINSCLHIVSTNFQ